MAKSAPNGGKSDSQTLARIGASPLIKWVSKMAERARKDEAMHKYFVIHTYKGDPEEIWKKLTEVAPGYAVAMAEGKTPARNLKTWNPFPYGRKDCVFCLWEAEKPEDIL